MQSYLVPLVSKIAVIFGPDFWEKILDLNTDHEIEFMIISETNFEKLEAFKKIENEAIDQVYEKVDGFDDLRNIFSTKTTRCNGPEARKIFVNIWKVPSYRRERHRFPVVMTKTITTKVFWWVDHYHGSSESFSKLKIQWKELYVQVNIIFKFKHEINFTNWF